MRRKFKNMNGKMLSFVIMSAILIVGHSLILFVEFGKIQGYLSIIPILFIAIQGSRMICLGIKYDGWSNGEIEYSTKGVIVIGMLPILGFQILEFTGISFWIWSGLFALLIVYVILNLIKLFSVKNSFYNDKYTLKSIEDALDHKDLRYKKSEKEPSKISDRKKTTLHVPNYECEIFKIKEKVFVKPTRSKTSKSIFDMIDFIETNAKPKE